MSIEWLSLYLVKERLFKKEPKKNQKIQCSSPKQTPIFKKISSLDDLIKYQMSWKLYILS